MILVDKDGHKVEFDVEAQTFTFTWAATGRTLVLTTAEMVAISQFVGVFNADRAETQTSLSG